MATDRPTDTLTQLLDGIPVGIAATRSGLPLYANAAGLAHAGVPAGAIETLAGGRVIRVDTVSLPIDGTAHEVRLSYDITEQRQLEDELLQRAYFDALTG